MLGQLSPEQRHHIQLLDALLKRDAAALQQLLADRRRGRARLARRNKPMGLWHALALSGFQQAVPLLVAAGVPVAGAADMAPLPTLQAALPSSLRPLLTHPLQKRILCFKHNMSALALAAYRGDVQVVAALLAAGANPNAAADPPLPWQLRPLAAAAVAAADCIAWQDALAVMQQLVAAGARAGLVAHDRLFARLGCEPAVRFLLRQLCAEASDGSFQPPPGDELLLDLLKEAVDLDDPLLLAQLAAAAGAPSWRHAQLAVWAQRLASRAVAAGRARVLGYMLGLRTGGSGGGESTGAPVGRDHLVHAVCHCQPQLLTALLRGGCAPLCPTSLALAEALAAAGLRPPVFARARVHYRGLRLPGNLVRLEGPAGDQAELDELLQAESAQPSQLVAAFNPGLEDPSFGVHRRCRFLWLVLNQQPWTPGCHRAFPAPFKRAARAFLLAAHRQAALGVAAAEAAAAAEADAEAAAAAAAAAADGGGGVQQEGQAASWCLGALPDGVLLQIIAAAAYPLSAWAAPHAEAARG
ncbi:hypothetical protein ABPG75_008022 [Micractinium tetrahymenae]